MSHITILLATYNGSLFLQEQLDSLFNQSHTQWTLLVHDDNSTDNTLDIIKKNIQKHPNKITLLEDNICHGTPSANFSFLLRNTDSNYIMFCDQDDIWLANKIKHTLNTMKILEDKYLNQPCMVFSDLEVVDEEGKTIASSLWKSQKLTPQSVHNTKDILALNVVTGCTIMLNKKTKELVSPIPKTDIEHDHWIAIHMSKHGHIAFIDEPLIKYRQHSSNTLGANNAGLSYFLMKTKKILQNRELFIKKYSHFRFRVSLPEILLTKIRLNLYRLLK